MCNLDILNNYSYQASKPINKKYENQFTISKFDELVANYTKFLNSNHIHIQKYLPNFPIHLKPITINSIRHQYL